MKTRYLALLSLVVGCKHVEDDLCAYDRAVIGSIIEGRAVAEGTPVPSPLKVVVQLDTEALVSSVYIRSADGSFVLPGQPVANSQTRWEILVYPPDVERFRDGFTAKLPVYASTLCGDDEYPIGESVLALGPPLGVVVSDLQIAPEPALPDCYVTMATAAPQFKVTAAPTSRGGTVTFAGSPGAWQNQAAMFATPLLGEAGQRPFAVAQFAPSKPGIASISAYATGALSNTYRLVVADAPQVTVSNATPARGITSWLDFTTAGNFDSCTVQSSTPDIAEVSAVLPREETFSSSIDVREAVKSCEQPELVRLGVTFNSSAPDGANVIVRCAETSYGRVASTTVTVGSRIAPPVTGLALAYETPLPDCYVPANGPITPVIRVDADPSSVGGDVTLNASHGSWVAPSGTPASISVRLGAADATARAFATFVPGTAGTALITASGSNGASFVVSELVVAGAPEVSAPVTSPPRGTVAWLEFTTAGNFDTCSVLESVPGSATAEIVSPALGALTTETSVRRLPQTCSTPETVRIGVTFAAGAPPGASVTVRCGETAYGRSISKTLTVGT